MAQQTLNITWNYGTIIIFYVAFVYSVLTNFNNKTFPLSSITNSAWDCDKTEDKYETLIGCFFVSSSQWDRKGFLGHAKTEEQKQNYLLLHTNIVLRLLWKLI